MKVNGENMIFNEEKFVRLVNSELKSRDWTISDLVRFVASKAPESLKINHTYINNVVCGRSTPRADYMGFFADFCGVSVGEFYQ